jgi:hypothetical protein
LGQNFAASPRRILFGVRAFFTALRTELCFERGCVKRFLPPAAAEFSFETDVFFMILRSKIMKNTSVSNFNLARSAVKNLFTQPLSK